MGSARSMTGGDLSLVKYMQDKQDKSDVHPRAYTCLLTTTMNMHIKENHVLPSNSGFSRLILAKMRIS